MNFNYTIFLVIIFEKKCKCVSVMLENKCKCVSILKINYVGAAYTYKGRKERLSQKQLLIQPFSLSQCSPQDYLNG